MSNRIPYHDFGCTIYIDPSRDARLTDQAKDLLKKFYMQPGETYQEAYARSSIAWARYRGTTDHALAQRLYEYSSLGWFGYASPILSNAPKDGEKVKGLPISCFAGYVGDTLSDLINHSTEFRWLSVKGGGVGGHWSNVRSVSDIAPGPIPFLKTVDADVSAYKQGKTRKGSYAAYMDISHPDIIEFVGLRVPTGDANRKCLSTGFHHAVNVTDDFMMALLSNDLWDLKDPHDGSIRETVKARELWEMILETRTRTGEPYINFIDTANRSLPAAQKNLGLKINGSNLCAEIHLPTGRDHLGNMRTFVCCLSSINIEMREEWLPQKDQFVGDLVTMLDNVLQFFIDNAPSELQSSKYSAERERAIGIGTMGLHAYMQKKGLSWESEESVALDAEIHKEIQTAAIAQSRFLATQRGEAPDMQGTGMRNSHLMALAPTANNASIVGTSPGPELWKANAFSHRTRAGTHLIKNKNLENLLEEKGQNTSEIWQNIILNRGSVQHLDFLTKEEKDIYKTAIEVNQMWVIRHASARQKYICQGQSINLFFPPGVSKKHINDVHIAAWKLGLKSLYYYRTEARNQADAVSKKIERVALKDHIANEEIAIKTPKTFKDIEQFDISEDVEKEKIYSPLEETPPTDDDGDCLACQG